MMALKLAEPDDECVPKLTVSTRKVLGLKFHAAAQDGSEAGLGHSAISPFLESAALRALRCKPCLSAKSHFPPLLS